MLGCLLSFTVYVAHRLVLSSSCNRVSRVNILSEFEFCV